MVGTGAQARLPLGLIRPSVTGRDRENCWQVRLPTAVFYVAFFLYRSCTAMRVVLIPQRKF